MFINLGGGLFLSRGPGVESTVCLFILSLSLSLSLFEVNL
jgi:hypothetical protein